MSRRSDELRGGVSSRPAPRPRRPPTAQPVRRTHARQQHRRRVVAPAPDRTRRSDVAAHGRSDVRLKILLVLTLAALMLVLAQVANIQLAGGDSYRAAGAEQWSRSVRLPADRGSIFDRGGEELAVSVPAYSVSVNPKLVTDEAGVAGTLQSLLGLDDGRTAELYAALVAKETGFVYVRRQIDRELGEVIDRLGLEGVNVDPEDRRILPGGDTGRSVIGRTDIDG
ncbi:MAG: peptidoglycan synthetase FtsI, partial [Actinomycetota bacterium]